MKSQNPLPVGKLPHDVLCRILAGAPLDDSVILGAGVGLDCAVVRSGDRLLVLKSDPITFTSQEIGWYAVQVNANDIATTGAGPRWFLATLLLPEQDTTPHLAESITDQVYHACQELGVSVVGGHTEITYGLDRPILIGTLIGEVVDNFLLMPDRIGPGDALLLTKGVPIEAIAILAREFEGRLRGSLTNEDIIRAQKFLFDPGISVLHEAKVATESGDVHAMHDPTEGGLSAALWEMAEASGCSLWFDPRNVPVYDLALQIADLLGVDAFDPLAAISSGALLLAVERSDADRISQTLEAKGITCKQIGEVETNQAPWMEEPPEFAVWQQTVGGKILLPRPEQDELARIFSTVS